MALTPELIEAPVTVCRWNACMSAAATVLAAAVAAVAPGLAEAAPAPVTLSPLPGTPDASPDTQISILGAPAKSIRSVTVAGSVSGAHSGHLASYSSRPGASFVLDAPLTQGEDVTAVVRIAGRSSMRSSFTIARKPPALAPFLPLSAQQPDKLQRFVSRPDLLAPKITVNKAAPELAGSIFLTPLPSPTVHVGGGGPVITLNPVGPGGPMIIDSRGRLVWFRQLPPDVGASALSTSRYRGKKVLTWWEGKVRAWAYGEGEGVIADTSYRELARVSAGNGYPADLHEFQVSPTGEALIAVYSPVCVSNPCFPAGADT